MSMSHVDYMLEAIKEAEFGIKNHHGGPFGCVIVKDDRIVGRGHNQVLLNNDSTCHGEMVAIRDACRNLHTYNLSGCILYTTAEPCPMCLGAIMWANITRVYYGCSKMETEKIGFRDDLFYKHILGEKTLIDIEECGKQECLVLFDRYLADIDRTTY